MPSNEHHELQRLEWPRLHERPPWEGLDESVVSALCLHLPELQRPACLAGPHHNASGVNTSLFQFLETLLFVSSPKELATITTAQVAVVFHNLSAREESAGGWWLVWTLLSWSAVTSLPFWLPFACKSVRLESFAIWSLVPLSYVQFVPQV